MFRDCCNFFKNMLYENGVPSLTRVLSIVAFAAFLICSIYLMVKGQVWPHYDTFAYITGGGGTTAQLFNKFFNSKYNSLPGNSPDKATAERPTAVKNNAETK